MSVVARNWTQSPRVTLAPITSFPGSSLQYASNQKLEPGKAWEQGEGLGMRLGLRAVHVEDGEGWWSQSEVVQHSHMRCAMMNIPKIMMGPGKGGVKGGGLQYWKCFTSQKNLSTFQMAPMWLLRARWPWLSISTKWAVGNYHCSAASLIGSGSSLPSGCSFYTGATCSQQHIKILRMQLPSNAIRATLQSSA